MTVGYSASFLVTAFACPPNRSTNSQRGQRQRRTIGMVIRLMLSALSPMRAEKDGRQQEMILWPCVINSSIALAFVTSSEMSCIGSGIGLTGVGTNNVEIRRMTMADPLPARLVWCVAVPSTTASRGTVVRRPAPTALPRSCSTMLGFAWCVVWRVPSRPLVLWSSGSLILCSLRGPGAEPLVASKPRF